MDHKHPEKKEKTLSVEMVIYLNAIISITSCRCEIDLPNKKVIQWKHSLDFFSLFSKEKNATIIIEIQLDCLASSFSVCRLLILSLICFPLVQGSWPRREHVSDTLFISKKSCHEADDVALASSQGLRGLEPKLVAFVDQPHDNIALAHPVTSSPCLGDRSELNSVISSSKNFI